MPHARMVCCWGCKSGEWRISVPLVDVLQSLELQGKECATLKRCHCPPAVITST